MDVDPAKTAVVLIEFQNDFTSDGGARLLLLFAPWPGEGHYRGDWTMPADVSAS